MRSRALKYFLCVLSIAALQVNLPRSLTAPQESPPHTILSKPVASFKVDRVCLVDALLQLGQQEGVPLGIEYVSREALEKPISLQMNETTAGEVIRTLLAQDRGYTWQIHDGVLNIGHESVAKRKDNLLDHVLPEFSVTRCAISDANNLLRMDLDRELHPQIQGFAGHYSPGDPQNVVGPFKLRNPPVWKVLNLLVSANKKAAWIVQVPPGHLDTLPSYGLWTIVEYENPPRRYAEVLRNTIWGSTHNPTDRE
jgi:hypothetical protein